MNFVYLPKGRKFSYIILNKRRVVAIAKFKDRNTGLSAYVIEVATPDNKSLSTLMIKNLLEGRVEYVIKEILEGWYIVQGLGIVRS